MSGPLGSQQWMYASGGFYPYEIDQSLRFNDDDTAYLSRTPASAGNRKTWTWSGWVKRGNLGGVQHLFQCNGDGNYVGYVALSFINDALRLYNKNSISSDNYITTSAVYRDSSSWYHVVAVLDTSNATASERAKLYVNGEQITSFSTAIYPPLNFEYDLNLSGNPHAIGGDHQAYTYYLDGYMAEVNFIDGQALDPTDFGEFKSGVWIPKSYSGTYGTNGFYLDFGNSGSLGADSSGNGNNWTPTNLAATDQVPDSPTNNFATFNPLGTATGTFSEGSLKVVTTDSPNGNNTSTISVNSGKWYAEFYYNAFGGNAAIIGVCDTAIGSTSLYAYSGGYSYFINGNKVNNNSDSAYGSSYTTGDIIGVSLNMDAGTVTFYKNGVSQGVAFSGLIGDFYFAVDDGTGSNVTLTANFGQDSSFAGNKTAQGNTDANGIGDFYYAPPAGYLALCTANLPDPAIDPAQDDVPADYFNTVLYTGNASTQSITGVGFQPDWVWIKERSSTSSHALSDAVRGAGNILSSDTTAAESTGQVALTAFNSDGFSVGNDGKTNQSGQTYVAWNWLAGNTSGSSNTDGTITSTVSANQKAGFSIATFTGNGLTAQTIGHGLSQPTELYIWKRRDSASDWGVETTVIDGTADFLSLNKTDEKFDSGTAGQYLPTSTTQYISFAGTGLNSNGGTYVCYSFHSVEGFSKFGSYTGNGSADGPFVYTGFRPAFLLIKRTSVSGNYWVLTDSARGTYNVMGPELYPNAADAESTGQSLYDYTSNGFKIRNNFSAFNNSGDTYIYMAFAEMPFKYSLGR